MIAGDFPKKCWFLTAEICWFYYTVYNIEKKAKQRYQKEVLSLLGVKFKYCRNENVNPLFTSEAVITQIVIPNIQNVKEN